jgi:peroxiredoxin
MLSAHFLPNLFRRVVFSIFRVTYNIFLFSGILFVGSLGGCSHKTGLALPDFDLLLVDSTTFLSSNDIPDGQPIVLVYFSPDCEHCQAETSDILSKIDSLKNIRFYFITVDPFERLKVFNKHFQINRYSNIILAKDYNFSFVNQLKPTGTPCILIYDRRKELRAVYNGSAKVENIIAMTKKL